MRSSAVLLGIAAIALLPCTARADVVHTKSGGAVEGELVREDAHEVELKVAYGSMTIERREIESIERKPTVEQLLRARIERLEPADAEGRVDVAQAWLERGLASPVAARLAQEAWRIAPAKDGARAILKKLGFQYDPGRVVWVPQEKWLQSHGFLHLGGRWLSREEVAANAAREALADARAGVAVAGAALANALACASGTEESELRAQAECLRGEQQALELRSRAARSELRAREEELGRASLATIAARSSLDRCGACAADPASRGDRERQRACAYDVWRAAAALEERVRAARDEALCESRRVTGAASQVAAKVGETLACAEAARGRAAAAREAIPALRGDVAAAQQKADLEEAAAKAAELQASESRRRAAADEAARDEASRRPPR